MERSPFLATPTGDFNTATGFQALFGNTTGDANTATGDRALNDNTTGIYNTATGYWALANNTEGDGNTATGYRALHDNTTGNNNTGHRLLRRPRRHGRRQCLHRRKRLWGGWGRQHHLDPQCLRFRRHCPGGLRQCEQQDWNACLLTALQK